MNKIKFMVSLFIVLAVLVIPAISKSEEGSGAVYTMTNDPAGNHVIRYDRGEDGALTNPSYFATNGTGNGSIIGTNQGGLVLSENGDMLFVVNAGSNEISAFQVNSKGLTLTDKVSSGGIQPISITIYKNLVYVVNAGGNGNIVGFHLDHGKLSQIPNSIRPLSSNSAGPAEISFNPDGDILVVTEKGTNMIDTYMVIDNGLTNGPIVQASNGETPFGFAFDNKGHLIVSEAFGGTLGAGALSSYAVNDNGNLKTISGSIPDFHTAPCWVVVTNNGKFAYTNNAHDGTTSSYLIGTKGMLSLLNPVAGTPGSTSSAVNIDMALSENSKFLYSLNAGVNTIEGFRVNQDGSLTSITNVSIPAGSDGLASR